MTDWNTAIEISASSVAVIGGIYTTTRHFLNSFRIKREMYREEILLKAREQADKVKEELEEKIKALEVEFNGQKESISKDLNYLKQAYTSEIKNLGEKIEDIRDQLNQQHGQLVSLLTRMIER
jgi:chromosome segregation ATPase